MHARQASGEKKWKFKYNCEFAKYESFYLFFLKQKIKIKKQYQTLEDFANDENWEKAINPRNKGKT